MKLTFNFLVTIFLYSFITKENKENDFTVQYSSRNKENNLSRTIVSNDSILFSDNKLKFIIDSNNEEGSKILNIYRNEIKILSHTILKKEGDCSSINVELGNYKLIGNKIIFYSYWAATDRQNISLFPFGFSKQTYQIEESGKVTKLNSEIFIEDNVEMEIGKEIFYKKHVIWRHKGIKFIYKKPTNNFEIKAKEDYIKSIEKMYKAKFVFGKEKKALEKEVRTNLKNEIVMHTGDWKEGEIYGTVKK